MLVTREQLERSYWKRKPKDYKHIREDGTKTVLHMGANGGTESWPLSTVPDVELMEHWQQHETVESIVKRHGLMLEVRTESWGDRPVPKEFYRGRTYRNFATEQEPTLPLSFREKNEWNNGYRAIYVSIPLRAIFTYCEGDLDLTVDADDATFEARLKSAEAFYTGRDCYGRTAEDRKRQEVA